MELRALVVVCVSSLLTCPAYGSSSLQRPEPQSEPGTYADMHAGQALGRIIVSPDGMFFLYEWGRPYFGWVPDVEWMAPNAARRLETFLYKVDFTPNYEYDVGRWKRTSEYLFYPNPGATYWLGDLSPDNRKVVLYELDHDDNNVRTGVFFLEEKQLKWFEPRPDEGRIEGVTAWISDDEFLYPAKGGTAKLIRANAATGEAKPCPECSMETIRRAEEAARAAHARALEHAAKIEADDIPEGANLVAASQNGELAVYVKDDDEVLMVAAKQPGKPVYILFENKRKFVPWQPPQLREEAATK